MNQVIRLRACLAIVKNNEILLAPHYNTDVSPIQWVIPGGGVKFGESLQEAAIREFAEETGLQTEIEGLLDVSEVIKPEEPWHSVSITFVGKIVGGYLRSETHHSYGEKMPRWFSLEELKRVNYHPKVVVEKALGWTARRGSREKLLAVLAKAPDVEPEEYDKL